MYAGCTNGHDPRAFDDGFAAARSHIRCSLKRDRLAECTGSDSLAVEFTHGRKCVLNVACRVDGPIEPIPTSFFVSLQPGAPMAKTVVLRANDGKAFGIVAVRVDGEGLRCMTPMASFAAPSQSIDLVFEVGERPKRRLTQGQVVVQTTKPDCAVVEIPWAIYRKDGQP